MEPELVLHGSASFSSPYVFSAFVALEEKRLPYELKLLSLADREHERPEYRDASITGRVPALRHGDFWLAESSAIAEYVEESFPGPKYPRLFPTDRRERATCREAMAWLRSDLGPIREERPTTTLWYERAKKPLSVAGQAAAERLVHMANALIRDGRTTLFADWCIADADLGLMLQRLNLNGDLLSPKLTGYAEAQWKRPSVAAWNAHPRMPFVPY